MMRNRVFCVYQNIGCRFYVIFKCILVHKWKKYTNLQAVKLHLRLQGACLVRLVGYTLDVHSPAKTVLAEQNYVLNESGEIVMDYPASDSALLAFEVETDSDCKLFGGWYEGCFAETDHREVNLSIATTTFKKEEFIQSNLRLLRMSY